MSIVKGLIWTKTKQALAKANAYLSGVLEGILPVCGTRRLDASASHFSTAAHPAPSLNLPQEALGLGAPSPKGQVFESPILGEIKQALAKANAYLSGVLEGILPVCGTRRLDASASRFSTAAQPYALVSSATGGTRARFPFPKGSVLRIP